MSTPESLKASLWKQFPKARKAFIGREKFDRIADIAIDRSPLYAMTAMSMGEDDKKLVSDGWVRSVNRQCAKSGEFGFAPLLLLFLAPVVGWMVTKLLDWWFDSSENRASLYEWKRDSNRF